MSYKQSSSFQVFLERGKKCEANTLLGAVCLENEQELFYQINNGAACMAGFMKNNLNIGLIKRNSTKLISFKTASVHNNKALEKTFYTWLLNESPWAEAYLEKDYGEVVKTGFVISTDLPSDFVASAAIATRFFTEKYMNHGAKRCRVFEMLMGEGLEIIWAFLLANYYALEPEGKLTFAPKAGHEILPVSWDLNGVKSFLTGNYSKRKATFREEKGYTTVGTTWEKKSEGPLAVSFATFALTLGNKKTLVNYNIFEKPSNNGYPLISVKDFPDIVKELKGRLFET